MQHERHIILMRHGRIQRHGEKRMVGCCDEALDNEGMATAHRRAEDFCSFGIGDIFCSPLRRSLDMGRVIAPALGARLHVERGLSEIDLGAWNGLPVQEIRARWPAEYAARGRDMLNATPPGGENVHDLAARVHRAFSCISALPVEKDPSPALLVIGHRSVNRVILSQVLGQPLEEMEAIPQVFGGYHVLHQRGVPHSPEDFSACFTVEAVCHG